MEIDSEVVGLGLSLNSGRSLIGGTRDRKANLLANMGGMSGCGSTWMEVPESWERSSV